MKTIGVCTTNGKTFRRLGVEFGPAPITIKVSDADLKWLLKAAKTEGGVLRIFEGGAPKMIEPASEKAPEETSDKVKAKADASK